MRKNVCDPNLSALEGVLVAEFSLPRLARRVRASLVLVVGLLFLAGCCLSDYQGKMIQEDEILLYQDKLASHLDAPLTFPERSEKDKDGKEYVTVRGKDVFIRPPKGFRLTVDKKPTPPYGTVVQ